VSASLKYLRDKLQEHNVVIGHADKGKAAIVFISFQLFPLRELRILYSVHLFQYIINININNNNNIFNGGGGGGGGGGCGCGCGCGCGSFLVEEHT
jgi:hypothetical protein